MLHHVFAVISIVLIVMHAITVNADQQNLIALRRQIIDILRLTSKAPVTHTPYHGDKVYCNDKTEYQLTCPQVHQASYTRNCCVFLRDCTDKIPAGETKYGINNNGKEDINSCICDKIFRDCLNRAIAVTGLEIYEALGKTYFNTEDRQCYFKERKSTCDGLFYDEAGESYESQDHSNYFCPVLRYHVGF